MPNWVQDHIRDNPDPKNANHCPITPEYLKGVTEKSDDRVTENTKAITPSGQWWNEQADKRKQEWREMVEFCGEDPDDFLLRMQRSFPNNPSQRKVK